MRMVLMGRMRMLCDFYLTVVICPHCWHSNVGLLRCVFVTFCVWSVSILRRAKIVRTRYLPASEIEQNGECN